MKLPTPRSLLLRLATTVALVVAATVSLGLYVTLRTIHLTARADEFQTVILAPGSYHATSVRTGCDLLVFWDLESGRQGRAYSPYSEHVASVVISRCPAVYTRWWRGLTTG
jgi:hypothetical protein